MTDILNKRLTIRVNDRQYNNSNPKIIRDFLDHRLKPIQWNKIFYVDNMNILNGMPSIEDDTFELTITDPPYNVNFRGNDDEIDYDDDFNKTEYVKWCKEWFKELKRVSKGIILFPGNTNVSMWCRIEEPRDIFDHFKPNCQGRASIAWKTKKEHVLFYGDFDKRLPTNVFKSNVLMGKNRELKKGIHTTPKPLALISHFLKHLKPKNVFDPFMGSATTAVAAKKLGIDYFGYELDPIYAYHNHQRIEETFKEPNQIELSKF